MRDDLIITFKFLEQINDVESKQFFKRCRDRATRGHNLKLSWKHVKKKYFYIIPLVNGWNIMTKDMVNADSIHKSKDMVNADNIHKSKELYDSRECSSDRVP